MESFHAPGPSLWAELMVSRLHSKSHITHLHSRAVPSNSGYLFHFPKSHTTVLHGPALRTSCPSSRDPLFWACMVWGCHFLPLVTEIPTCTHSAQGSPSSLSGKRPSSFSASWSFQLFINWENRWYGPSSPTHRNPVSSDSECAIVHS